MTDAEKKCCDKCNNERDILTYFQNHDLHICLICLRSTYEKLLELVQEFTRD